MYTVDFFCGLLGSGKWIWAPVLWVMCLMLLPLRPFMKRWCWGAMSRWVVTEMVLARLPARCSNSRAVPLCGDEDNKVIF